jgi:UDPglucose 6-dehydrogenase
MKKIAWIGLGKLGLPCASVISKKFEVVGYDINIGIEAPFRIADTIEDCINGADIIFVAVPTPHAPEYSGDKPSSHLAPRDFDYSIVKSVLTKLSQYRNKDQHVVLVSTVMPRTIRREFAKLIPDLVYNPSLIATGTVAEDFVNPDIIILGNTDGKNNPAIEKLFNMYGNVCHRQIRYTVGTWEEAEITKISYNVFATMKVNFVNTLNDISRGVGHSNIDVITNNLFAASKRLHSPDYMTKAGMGIAGPCHPRDINAMEWLVENLHLGYETFGEMMHVREVHANNLARKLCSYGKEIVILGIGFKKNLPDTDGSYSLLVAHYLKKLGCTVHIHDPLNSQIYYSENPCVYLLSQPHSWISDYDFADGSTIVDPWRTGLQITNCTVVKY